MKGFIDVNFSDACIQTTVTSSPAVVDKWVSRTYDIHRRRLHLPGLVVGLDVEWRPYFPPTTRRNPVATLQLCIGRRCLIVQILHAQSVPASLARFLADPCFVYVGVGVQEDVDKLFHDYNLRVRRSVDLAAAAAATYQVEGYKHRGLKRLAKELLGQDMAKPIHVTLSEWDAAELSPEQIEYACIDAYVSFELGLLLRDHVVAQPSSSSYFDQVVDRHVTPIVQSRPCKYYYCAPPPPPRRLPVIVYYLPPPQPPLILSGF